MPTYSPPQSTSRLPTRPSTWSPAGSRRTTSRTSRPQSPRWPASRAGSFWSRTRSSPASRWRRPRSSAIPRTCAPTPRTSGGGCWRARGSRSSRLRSARSAVRSTSGWPGLRRPQDPPEGEKAVVPIIVDRSTRLVVQGLTGSEGRFHGTRNKAYGTQVVAGVTPGKGGQDVEGIPVYDTVAEAVGEAGAKTAMVFVPAPFAADAIYEAVDAGIGTVVCIAEGLPAHDMLRVYNHIRPLGVTMIG